MSIFKTLSKEDKDLMYDYIYLYGARSNCVQPISNIEHLLRFWDSAKSEYLSDIFNGELILSKNITFQKDNEEMAEEIGKNITRFSSNNDCREFLNAWHELCHKLTTDNENNDIYWAMNGLTSNAALASNRYRGSSAVDIPLPNGKKYRLLGGAKTSKAIGKIASVYNLPKYEEFRIAVSQILNQKSVSGEFCLSIHPMDYMTMSDNDCGWGSCMSWYDHGDFRQGTVEMMNSPMVIVAYLKSSTDYCISRQDETYWNSKRWRQLFIVTPELIAAIKGYPYWNKELEASILHWIKEVVENSGVEGFGPYENEIRIYDAHRGGVDIPEEDMFLDLNFDTHLMYNDLYDRHAVILKKDHVITNNRIHYSGVSECMSCGNELYNYESESDLFCSDCDPVYRCCECGEWHAWDELIEVDGELYCEWCYNDRIVECSDCGNPHNIEDMNEIFLAKDDNTVYVGKFVLLDDDCYWDERFFNRKDVGYFTCHYRGISYILMKDLTEEGLEAFGFDSLEDALEYEDECIWTRDNNR